MKKSSEAVSIRDVYELVDTAKSTLDQSINKQSDRINAVEIKIGNIEGRLMMIAVVIGIAINVFFFIVELVLKPK